jgi:hypothetical protein
MAVGKFSSHSQVTPLHVGAFIAKRMPSPTPCFCTVFSPVVWDQADEERRVWKTLIDHTRLSALHTALRAKCFPFTMKQIAPSVG